MFLHTNTLTWTCQQCSTHWNPDYLRGWNDGYKAAQPNDDKLTPPPPGRTDYAQ